MMPTRRHLLAAFAGGLAAPAVAQARATLSAPWMGWPEEQVRPLLGAFESANPAVRIQEERLPIGELFRTLEVRLSARTPTPDVYLVDGPLTASYAAREHLLDLTPMMQPMYPRFLKAAVDQGLWRGRMFAAPMATSTQVLYCNRRLFEAAGVPLPSGEVAGRMTWEAVVDLAARLTDAGRGVWGFQFENSARPYQVLPVPQSWGAEVIGPDGLTAAGFVDSPAMVEALSWYQGLYQGRRVAPPGVFDNGVVQEMFGGGRIAMMLGGTWNLDGLRRFPNLDVAVAPHPHFAGKRVVTPTGSWHIGINPRTRFPEQSQALLRFLMTTEAMELWFRLRQNPPVLTEVWDRLAPTDFTHPMWAIVRHELANTAVPRPSTPGFREYEDLLRIALQDIQTGAPVADTLRNAARAMDREFRKYRSA